MRYISYNLYYINEFPGVELFVYIIEIATLETVYKTIFSILTTFSYTVTVRTEKVNLTVLFFKHLPKLDKLIADRLYLHTNSISNVLYKKC